MVKLREIVGYLDKLLKIKDIEDKSHNGLQVEGREEVKNIVLGVDACLELFEKAVKEKADMIIVHHGILWNGVKHIDKVNKRRLQLLFDNDISLYGVHLPLDKQEEIGNNAKLLELLGIKRKGSFEDIGYWGELKKPMELDKFVKFLEKKLDTKTIVLKFGSRTVKNVAVVSGGGAHYISHISKIPVDTFITGEPVHYAYIHAKEGKINVVYAGHYKTETLGVQGVGDKLREKFPELNVKFIACPTGF